MPVKKSSQPKTHKTSTVLKKSKNVVNKKSVMKTTRTKKRVVVATPVQKSTNNIKDLITEMSELELNLFLVEDNLVEHIEDNLLVGLKEIESPQLFLEDLENLHVPEYLPSQAVDVMIKSSYHPNLSQHVLDLSKSKIDKVNNKKTVAKFVYKDFESFILSSDEDGLWQNILMFMNHEHRSGAFYNFLNLSWVSLILLIGRVGFQIFNQIIKTFNKLILFFAKGLINHIKTLITVIRLAVRGQLNRDNLLNPEQALVDIALFEKPVNEPRLQFNFSQVAIQSMVMFIILSLVIILPVKGMAFIDILQKEKVSVLGTSESAYSSLQLAVDDIQQFSWLAASAHFQDSRDQFAAVHKQFQDSHTILQKILKTLPSTKNKIETAEHLIQVGIEVSSLGEKIANLLNILQSEQDGILLTGKIRAIQKSLDDIRVIQTNITEDFSYIDIDALPDDLQSDVLLLKESLPEVFANLNQIEDLINFAYIILGGDKQQNYLLVFQNSDELRATGGFMGSLTTVTLYQGRIISMDTPGGGPYDWQAWLTQPTIAPKPLWLVNPVWQFQDANWFVDFPTSAQKILNFYNQTKLGHIDGVIAINSYVLPEILKLTGDIELSEYDKVLTSDNVLYEIQSAVELEYDKKENKPKKIIGDLFTEINNKLLKSDSVELIDLLQIINNGLLNRDIQMYFTDNSLQTKVHNWRWSGEVQNTNGDYMMLVNSNIGGGKTDKFIVQDAILDSYIQPDGSIINELTISRTNNGIPGDVFYGYNNVDYLRVYVPEGSELIEVSGDLEPPKDELFEQPPSTIPDDIDLATNIVFDHYDVSGVQISQQFNKTVFGLWLQTNLGETSTVTIRYSTPVSPIVISTESDSPVMKKIDEFLSQSGVKSDHDQKIWYNMYWQKQSGQHHDTIDYSLHFPNNWTIEHTIRPGFLTGQTIEYKTLLEQDFSTGFLFGRN